MHYMISSAMKPGKVLTTRQKNHPFFSEAPRIGAKVVRHNHPLRLTKEQFKLSELTIKRLFDAQAIDITEIETDEKGVEVRRTDIRKEMHKAGHTPDKIAAKSPLGRSQPPASTPVVQAEELKPEPTASETKVDAPATVVEVPVAQPEQPKSKKGKKA